ncbi:LON peptidase substrate-binding domain-containing protein [Colwellia sp. 75C3]|uniref:LON peptidase substrate-binding domain-containing protein n=1 Tax=Colwellia sp. 75C3 TaxID=888425 RepID=UPI0012FF3FA7|nr:LON peptidase substrate-binding domain-containing protein [Colwellia sp. 75C3]
MNETTVTLPIFPLPVFLLPEGVTKLRIFEPRYLKMMSIASSNQGFVIWLNDTSINADDKGENMQWGSWVDIINFDQGDDGILEIDVKCKSLVVINSVEQDNDNLHFGDVSYIKHWSDMSTDKATSELSTSLESIFAQNEALNALYPEKLFNDSHWVLARWLEILPIELGVKNDFVVNHNFQKAKLFVESIIFS